MVIVIITIVLMGGATEPLMDRLGVRTNVDNEEYMRAWHQQRKLKGRFLHFGMYTTLCMSIDVLSFSPTHTNFWFNNNY